MNNRFTWVRPVVLTLLLVPFGAMASSPPGSYSDPEGDQQTSGIPHQFENTAYECRDPATDVVWSSVSLTNETVYVEVEMKDLGAALSCGDLPVTPRGRIGVVHLYFNYSAGLGNGHYLSWQHDESAQTICARIYAEKGGWGLDSSTCMGTDGTVSGNTLSWDFPRNGTFKLSKNGTLQPYDLKDPLVFYGVTYSNGLVAQALSFQLKDQYAW